MDDAHERLRGDDHSGRLLRKWRIRGRRRKWRALQLLRGNLRHDFAIYGAIVAVLCRVNSLHQDLIMQTLYGMDASGVSTGAVKQIEDNAATAPGWVPVAPPALADGQI